MFRVYKANPKPEARLEADPDHVDPVAALRQRSGATVDPETCYRTTLVAMIVDGLIQRPTLELERLALGARLGLPFRTYGSLDPAQHARRDQALDRVSGADGSTDLQEVGELVVLQPRRDR